MGRKIKCELFNDNFQNFKKYNIPKAQLVICDIPYNVGDKAYGSSPLWYVGGITATGRATRRKRVSSIQMAISKSQSISTSATAL